MRIHAGTPTPLGLSIQSGFTNFSLFSSHANEVFLGLFTQDGTLLHELPLERSGDYWHVAIEELPTGLNYAFRLTGPSEMCYDPSHWLIDPYAKIVKQGKALAEPPKPFDWQNDSPPRIEKENLIIYEMHVRGFTQDPSSKTTYPGTYLGMIEKIPYLKKLGINAVELMPIFDSDEWHTKTGLPNYWNYNPFHFFAPKSQYAHQEPVDECKTLIRELHKNGIEVILDVVYNHTGEGKDRSFAINFRGIDNEVYYMLDSQGNYLNFSGCFNTFNCNHPVVTQLILDSLRYWVEEMHVDGFRFDLASILTRNEKGHVLDPAPLIEKIVKDPVIGKVKLIAESWDAEGLYQVGTFPKWGPFSEWNDQYRDTVRKFFKSEIRSGDFANVLAGSESLYGAYSPLSSVNFITAHDGFTLRDLVSYKEKHNQDNRENNEDGSNHNNSSNWGVEGPTQDPHILVLRERQMRNFLVTLFLSQGIPMLTMGDVYGHTSLGNNNPYCQDNRISWFLWDELQRREEIFQYISQLIQFRQSHPQLKIKSFLEERDIQWHSPNWDSSLLSCTYKNDTPIFIAFNGSDQAVQIKMPSNKWKLITNTAEDWKIHTDEIILPEEISLLPYSVIIALQF